MSDATLARLWTGGLETGTGTHPHLEGCGECRARFDALARWIDDVAVTLRDEADEVLTPERLSAQQAQIARRLESIGRPARVLAFPKAARAVISGHSNVRRWVTAAAAACLIAGFTLGQAFPVRQLFHKPLIASTNLTQAGTIIRAQQITPEPSTTLTTDEELLSYARYSRPHVQTLSALDDMTPHARDIVLNKRNKQYK